ncbi:tetratricopeptide repeat protein [Polynucleobacter sp. CS-Odin-A6]|uniref:tetratricopeptide repeat protein n=1 Tax=Polynucleobacter sp. CS-Odin-A6 TaxID=2689106 RepID=UPI001C0BCB23|nr:tetratricopeptide repeat protein [Polynucleobacter sp. CS-Odin-A6]MBU3621858.1 tetratricopeptide repeat protein [Polynucleobacter sp. CS-Odin-A6]
MNDTVTKALDLIEQGHLNQAKWIYESILQDEPHQFDALYMLGALLTNEDPDRSIQLLSKAIEINPHVPECFVSAASALIQLEKYQLALDCCQQALSLKANSWEANANLSAAFYHLKRWNEALIYSNIAISLQPQIAKLYSNRGNVLQELFLYDQALEDFGVAIELDASNPQFYLDRSKAYHALQLTHLAIEDLQKAIMIEPLFLEAQIFLAQLYLLSGSYQLGWSKYDWRWQCKDSNLQPLIIKKPRWVAGSNFPRVLIWAEQGVAEHIFFGGLLPEMKKLVSDLIVQVDPSLISLFQRSMPDMTFYSTEQIVDEKLYDAHLPMGDLAGLFRNHLDDFCNVKTQFLVADQQHTDSIKEALSSKDQLLIGISCNQESSQADPNRILELSRLVSTLNIPSVKFVSLDDGDHEVRIQELQKQSLIEVIQRSQLENQSNLDDLASLIRACDLIISVDNPIVHLAGALNKPCWVLLAKMPDWRWLLNVNLTPWYPSLRLCRQTVDGQWDDVLQKIRADLMPLFSSPGHYH